MIYVVQSTLRRMPYFEIDKTIVLPTVYIVVLVIAKRLDMKTKRKKVGADGDLYHSPKLINCSLYHCRAILNISHKSTHNVLHNGRISD